MNGHLGASNLCERSKLTQPYTHRCVFPCSMNVRMNVCVRCENNKTIAFKCVCSAQMQPRNNQLIIN